MSDSGKNPLLQGLPLLEDLPDLDGAVGGVGVHDMDVVGPGDRGHGPGQIALFVLGEDQDGDHVGSW